MFLAIVQFCVAVYVTGLILSQHQGGGAAAGFLGAAAAYIVTIAYLWIVAGWHWVWWKLSRVRAARSVAPSQPTPLQVRAMLGLSLAPPPQEPADRKYSRS